MITIAGRLKPFSHSPGCRCLLPSTSYVVEGYPALVRIRHLSGELVKEIALDIQGPLKNFTLMQNLEKGCVTVFSELYSFHILPNLDISYQKNPPIPARYRQERLALGSHKRQDWDEIKKRCDFCEIFPIWFRLGNLMANLPERVGDNRGIFELLEELRQCIERRRPEAFLVYFKRLFLAGFSHLLVPRASDDDYLGIISRSSTSSMDSPIYLLTEGCKLIRSLFISSRGDELFILPHLPPEFFAGRMMHIEVPFGTLDFEWSKKTIKKLHFHAAKDAKVLLHFPKMCTFRVRTDLHERGKSYSCGESLEIKSGTHYLLDQFQK